ncbi:hypothetical protein E6A54_05600 [Lactobacillus johnsonii]|uniref:AAA family ATPase n=1 Tax=Lactobacillus johnsonii TaxID=33959 RepID=UPI001303EF25|nr:AAA family ATPase [Lactobacillus johnsonii]QGY96775.1 hypothetical protein E6A54_05600 [Lactobacillus johnsonii]
MLENLKDITKKSFNHIDIGDLKKINCFFGINGSGKTALAACISDIDQDHTICFDTKFVEDNMSITDSNNSIIKGIKLKIGKQVQDEKKIKDLTQEINSIEKDIGETNNKLDQDKKQLYKILDKQLKEARTQFKTNSIHQKPNAEKDPVQAMEKWLKEAKGNELKNLDNLSDINISIENLQTKINLQTAFLNRIRQINFKELQKDLEKVVVKPDSRLSRIILAWLEEGLKLHKITEDNSGDIKTCLFCGNEFNSKNIAKKYFPLIKSEYSKLINRCNDKKSAIKALTINLKENYQSENYYKDVKENLDNIEQLLEDKIRNTEEKIEISKSITSNFNATIAQVKQSVLEDKEKFDELQKIKQRIEEYAKRWVGYSLSKNKVCFELKENIYMLEKETIDEKNKIETIRNRIASIKVKQSDLSEFSKLCNHKFESIGLRLKLEVDPNESGYLIKEKHNIGLHASDLSEGERRILAFLIFFYKMRNARDEIKPDTKIIIIDDPITSLDAENSYEIVEMINQLIREVQSIPRDIQLFIFTNSSRAFHDIGYFDLDQRVIKRWIINKDENGYSNAQPIDKKEYLNRSDYYRQIFNEVATFAFLSRSNVESQNSGLLYCNKARILIESHAYSNYNIANATSSATNFSTLMKVYNIPDKETDTFRKDLDIINGNSHGFSNIDNLILEEEYDPVSIQRAVRDIIGILNCKDADHIDCMLGSMLDKNKKIQLKGWSEKWGS